MRSPLPLLLCAALLLSLAALPVVCLGGGDEPGRSRVGARTPRRSDDDGPLSQLRRAFHSVGEALSNGVQLRGDDAALEQVARIDATVADVYALCAPEIEGWDRELLARLEPDFRRAHREVNEELRGYLALPGVEVDAARVAKCERQLALARVDSAACEAFHLDDADEIEEELTDTDGDTDGGAADVDAVRWEDCRYPLRGTLPAGEACRLDVQCASGVCDGACEEEAICDGAKPCPDGLACTTTGCVARPVEGEACNADILDFVGVDFDVSCGPGLVCVDDTCARGAQLGERCDEDGAAPARPCADALICVSGTCAKEWPVHQLGEPCVDAECAEGLWCDFEHDRCERYASAGESCAERPCDPALYCFAPDGDDDSMLCQPLRKRGEACDYDHPCGEDGEDLVCEPSDPDAIDGDNGRGTCQAYSEVYGDELACPCEPLRDGAICVDDTDVPGWHCEPVDVVDVGAACDERHLCKGMMSTVGCLDGVCRQLGSVADDCSDDSECRDTLLCIAGSCAPALRWGEACDEEKCADHLSCVDGHCDLAELGGYGGELDLELTIEGSAEAFDGPIDDQVDDDEGAAQQDAAQDDGQIDGQDDGQDDGAANDDDADSAHP